MFDVSKLFGKGDKNTLLMKNGLNFSYNGPYATVVEGLILDRFHVGTFCSAEYTISICLLYTSPSPRDLSTSRMPSSA